MKRLMLLACACALPLALLGGLVSWMGSLGRSPAAPVAGVTFAVNTTADTSDADVGNRLCADGAGQCSLRAAVMQANYLTQTVTITLPAGVYLLTRVGDDAVAVLGDLDIAGSLHIQGAGSARTIVDGNGAITGDRVFQVLSTAKDVSFSGLTIRDGSKVASPFDEGGGLAWDGGGGSRLQLKDLVIEDNRASYSGGLQLNYSANGDQVDLQRVIVHANTATAAGGGLSASFNDFASFSLRDSQVYSNSAYEGGGLYFQGASQGLMGFSARVQDSQVYSNSASLSAGLENHSGDAGSPVVIQNSLLQHNHAGFYGGAIGNYGALALTGVTVDANTAAQRGGGLYDYEGGLVDIQQSTFSGNFAQLGGGIFTELFIHNAASVTLANSTVSGNTASRDGGGLYAQGGHVQLTNATVANNQVYVPVGTVYAGLGGGVYITATAVVSARSALLGGNSHRYRILAPEPDDCFTGPASLSSLGYNLIESAGGCLLSGTLVGNLTGQDPRLGPLGPNGGPTRTQAPLPGSPAIDAGDDPSCPPVDQRGFSRIWGAHCDIGAVEAQPDLGLQARLVPGQTGPGGGVRFTLLFSNTGSLPASGVTITASFPAQIQLTGIAHSGAAITGGLSAPPAWQVQELGYLQGGVITLTGSVRSDAASGLLTSTARIAGNPPDSNPSNDTAQVALQVSRRTYLALLARRN